MDIASFLVLILTALTMFGIPMLVLNLNRSEDSQIIMSPFDFWAIDMLLNQYF